ncbi:MAG: putative 26S proteasome regulatory complex, non-ATPase subcomplex, Rpn2/Psmd1 subunit, partial [Streblomastix strix]
MQRRTGKTLLYYFHNQEKALDFALLAGDAFEYKKETPYVYTIADQAISRYGKVRRQLEDGKIGQKYRNEQISREKKDKEQVEAKKDMDKDEDDDNEILKLQLQEIEDDLSELIIDEKLEVLYGKLVDYSFEKEEYKEIIGLGFEGIRIDVVERCIRKVNEKEQQRKKKDLERREKKKDINKSGMDKDEQFDKEDRKDNKDISSFDIMDYCFNLSNDFTTETGFRRSVCKLLVKIYGETDQDNEDYEYDIEQNEQQQLLKEEDEVLRIEREKKKKIKQQFVRIFGMAKCLCVLEDSQQLGKILARLLREGSSESYACALQIAFDIYDSGTQDICINVILVLRAEELYELKKEEDLVIQSESDSSSTKQQDKQQLYKKRRIREITRRIVSIEQILQGEKSTQLYLQFLSSKANIDKQDVLDLEVDKQSFLLLGAMLGNGIMHCGTIKDAFVRENTQFYQNAAHWNRFNVAASFGLIHRGHNKVAFNVLKDYLPTTNSLKDVQQKISEIEKKEEQEKKKDEEIGYIEEDDYVEAKKEQEQKPDVEQPPIQQQPQQQPSIFPLSTPQQSSSSTAPTGQQEPSHLFPTNTNQNQNTIPADLIGSVMRGSLGQGNRGGRGGRRGGRGQGNVDPNQFIQEQFGQQTGLNGQGQGNDPSPYSEAGALFGLGLIFGGNGASSSLSTSILGSSSSSSSTASLAAVNPLSQSTSQMPQLFSSSYSSSPIPSISSLVLPYLLSTLDELQATSPNYVVHQHGLALAIGSVGMGSKDSILANTLLQIVMQDNANAGEAACIGIGLIMLGTGSLSGLLYEQLLQVAHQTKHEKIVRAVGVGIGLIFAGQKSEADIIISELCMDSDELLRYGGVFTIGTAYAGCPLSSVVSKLFTIAATDPSGDVKRQAVISLGLLYASTGNGSNTQINYEKKEEKKDLKKDEKKETKNIKSRSSSPSLNAAPIQSKISPPPQSISSTPSPAPPSAQSTSQQTSSQSSSSSIDTTFNSQSIDMFIRSLFPLCDSFDPNIRAGVGLALGIAV